MTNLGAVGQFSTGAILCKAYIIAGLPGGLVDHPGQVQGQFAFFGCLYRHFNGLAFLAVGAGGFLSLPLQGIHLLFDDLFFLLNITLLVFNLHSVAAHKAHGLVQFCRGRFANGQLL